VTALPEPPTTVTLEVRRLRRTLGMAVKFRVYVDGDRVGVVANDCTVRFPVEPGRHTVTVKMFGVRGGSAVIDAHPGERVILNCWAPDVDPSGLTWRRSITVSPAPAY